MKSLQAIKDSNVVVLLIDARDGIVEQDLHLLGYVILTRIWNSSGDLIFFN